VQKIFFLFLILVSEVFAWKIEAGSITVKNKTVSHINLRQTYDTTPLIFLLPDSDGGDSASIRITNVSTTGFDAFVVEPQGSNGGHKTQEKISYIAIEKGSHELPGGTKIVAGSVNTHKFQPQPLSNTGWESVSISGFSSRPIVLGMIQTTNNEEHGTPPAGSNDGNETSQPWLTTAIDNVTSSSFNIALERSETTDGNITQDEKIAYLVIEAGKDSYFGSNIAKKITYKTILKTEYVDGWSPNPSGVDIFYGNTYANSPIVVATKNSRKGNDGGWLRSGAGDGQGAPTDHINLRVDEDKAKDSERKHNTKEDVGIIVFSEPFDVEFDYSTKADLTINEVMFRQTTTGNNNDEFVELYVAQGGEIEGYVLSDQDCYFYRFPPCQVTQGDYVIFHTGNGTNSCSGNVKHFYDGRASLIWNDDNDDVLLLQPANDVTTTTNTSMCGTETFNAKPVDYMAYGRNSSGGNVDAIPTSMNNVSVQWTYTYGTELQVDINHKGLSISLTPNATDSDKAACWEQTASGNASDNGCAHYLPTRDTNPDAALTYSMGENNNALPEMHITKTSIVINDPVNGTDHPKRIPGATIRYCFTIKNTGDGSAENAAIHDTLDGNNRDRLTYAQSGKGSLVNNTNDCSESACRGIGNNSGSYNNGTKQVDIDLATPFLKDNHQCAYIEATIN